MARLEMFVRLEDGSGRVVEQCRDGAIERREMDRLAWHWLAKARVVSVQVRPVTGRMAGYVKREVALRDFCG